MGFTIANGNEKVGTGDVLTLLERTEAKKQPINRREFTTFLRHPGGAPPEQCVSVALLPGEYECVEMKDSMPMFIGQLLLTPSGKLCITTKIGGRHTVVCGEKKFSYKLDKSETAKIRVIGFTANEQPIVHLDLNAEKKLFTPQSALFIGKKKIEGQFVNPQVLPNGMIVFARQNRESNSSHHGVFIIEPPYEKTVMVGDDYDHNPGFGISSSSDILYVGNTRDNNHMIVNAKTQHYYPHTATCKHIAHTNEGQFFIGWYALCSFGDEENIIKTPNSLDIYDFEYLRGLTLFPQRDSSIQVRRAGYITRAKDGLESWIIDKETQPAFDIVSPLYQEGDLWYYFAYNAGRRQLITMQLPSM